MGVNGPTQINMHQEKHLHVDQSQNLQLNAELNENHLHVAQQNLTQQAIVGFQAEDVQNILAVNAQAISATFMEKSEQLALEQKAREQYFLEFRQNERFADRNQAESALIAVQQEAAGMRTLFEKASEHVMLN